MTTPNPPQALIEAMAQAYEAELDRLPAKHSMARPMSAALRAASEAGWVLVPRVEVEEAADYIESPPDSYSANPEMAERLRSYLRERSRG